MLAEKASSSPPIRRTNISRLKPLPVTIDQMMRNSADCPTPRAVAAGRPASTGRCDRRAAACVRNNHLNCAGQPFLYSNTNFLLLGLIIEKLAERRWGVHGRTHLQPLGMTARGWRTIDAVIPGLHGYLGDAESGFAAPHAYPQAGEGTSLDRRGSADLGGISTSRCCRLLTAGAARAAAPLTGGHARSIAAACRPTTCAPATVSHGGLAGYRTEFLRVPRPTSPSW